MAGAAVRHADKTPTDAPNKVHARIDIRFRPPEKLPCVYQVPAITQEIGEFGYRCRNDTRMIDLACSGEEGTSRDGAAITCLRWPCLSLCDRDDEGEDNPADLLRGALTTPQVTHHAAILDPKLVGELLRSIEGYSGKPETLIALKIAPHVFVRPGELRQAEWQEFDLDGAVWRIPAEKMKMAQPHAVPLSTQVVDLLRQLRGLSNASSYLFPAFHTTRRCMSENTLNSALRRLGYSGDEMTSHGFRAVASTLLNESGLWHPDAIERSLAHKDPDQVRAAYHRGAHWAERVRMMQWWSDHLEHLRDGAKVLKPAFRRA